MHKGKKDWQHLDIYGCMGMYGAHIALCIKDYADVHKHEQKLRERVRRMKPSSRKSRLSIILHNYDTARAFLFDGFLDNACDQFSLPLEADAVRRYAIECAKRGHVITKGTPKVMFHEEAYSAN